MKTHETHQIGSTEFNGEEYEHCKVCGAVGSVTNVTVMEAPCQGKPPELDVIDDGDMIAIQWSFPEGGVKSSEFPQPLVTVDYALDGRPVQVVFAGPRARELREALKPKLDEEQINELKGMVRGGVKWVDIYKGDAYLGTSGARLASRLLHNAGIETHVDGRTGEVTFT